MKKRIKDKPVVSKEASDLILTQLEAEAEADNLLASLTVLAYGSNDDSLQVTNDTKVEGRRKSRFFSKPSLSFNEEAEERKKKFVPRELEHIDKVVERRLTSYKEAMPKELNSHIKCVREFFLKEIAPLTLGSIAGTSQAQDIVQRMLGTSVDGSTFEKYDRMLRVGVNIAMARFIANYLNLPKSASNKLLAELEPKVPKTVVFPSPTQNEPKHRVKNAVKESSNEAE